MKIHILNPKVADQIAAGEVVERPSSVVKECVENSLDAGAKNIEILIEKGGKQKIEVRDDGAGMDPEDAEKCFLRHATSKIRNIDDLFAVRSFGFRGEALAAISSVSKTELITKTASEDFGVRVKISGGTIEKKEKVPANKGTSIKIEDLFYITPARRQYLKTDETEYRHIWKEIRSFALANPEVGFKLHKDKKIVLDLPGAGELKKRLAAVENFPESVWQTVEYQDRNLKVSGYIVHPHHCIKNKNHQFIFVNHRHIEDYRLNFAVREAYAGTVGLENQWHPVFALFLEIDPILADMNVHPRKLEVKFAEPGEVFRGIKNAVSLALSEQKNQSPNPGLSDHPKSIPGPKNQRPSVSRLSASFQAQKKFFSAGSLPFSFSERNIRRNQFAMDREAKPKDQNTDPPPEAPEWLKLIGQIAHRYIAAEAGDGIYIFDQHALHERIRFEKLLDQAQKKEIRIQNLLLPSRLEFSEDEIGLLHENQEKIREIGFSVRFPADHILEVTAVPVMLKNEPLTEIFYDMAQYFQQEQIGQHTVEKFLRKILESKSCRGSVMFGEKLETEAMEKLLEDFVCTRWNLSCPHGRPNHIFWSFRDLEKMFHR